MTAREVVSELLGRIAQRDYRVAIVGMGYVGVPLALAFLREGFAVVGIDADVERAASLRAGGAGLESVDSEALGGALQRGTLRIGADASQLSDADAILLCVPTPLDEHREPDMTAVLAATQLVAGQLRSGQLVVLESTTYPGTSEELVRPVLEQGGLRSGEDFYLAYSPEREDLGNPDFETRTIPKLVGGADRASGDLAEALYGAVMTQVVRVRDTRIAEAAKLTENVFRAVNIALVNELKVTFDRMGIDVWEVLDAAESKPFGFMRFNPGPGWGGHCIPIDPFYLSWKAREYGAASRFIELAGEINIRMHEHVVEKLTLALNERKKPVNGARVLLLGVAYKKDVQDCRESPAFPILRLLESLGAHVAYHDSNVPRIPELAGWSEFGGRESTPLDAEQLADVDAVIVVTDHSDVDYLKVLRHAALIVDTRCVFRERAPNIVRA